MEKTSFFERYGKWAIVAGGSQGIGAAYAEELARRGLHLLLLARRAEALEALSKSLSSNYKIQVRALPLDLSTANAARMIDDASRALDVGLLVYNAAFSAIGPFLGRSLEDHFRELDTNVRTPLELVYLFGQRMLERGRGGVLLMSSLSSFQGSAYISTYSATKAFTTVFAEGLWEEWRGRGVDALVCISGAVRTPGYVASSPRRGGGFSDSTLEPGQVVREALDALGRRPYVIPGGGNRLASFIMRHLVPRRAAIRIMGRVLRRMYARE